MPRRYGLRRSRAANRLPSPSGEWAQRQLEAKNCARSTGSSFQHCFGVMPGYEILAPYSLNGGARCNGCPRLQSTRRRSTSARSSRCDAVVAAERRQSRASSLATASRRSATTICGMTRAGRTRWSPIPRLHRSSSGPVPMLCRCASTPSVRNSTTKAFPRITAGHDGPAQLYSAS
jgi:hypothetical protein